MTRVPGIRGAAPLLALAIALPLWLVASTTLSLARQDDLAPVEIGAGPVREQALAFTGRHLYSRDSVELFGYLTAVIGLQRDILFSDTSAPPSPRTARFTYAGSVSITSRTDRADVTTTTGDGVMRIYLHVNDAGAAWDDPGSFATGEPVAEYAIQLRDTLQRQGPGVGVLVGDGQLTQQTAAELSFGGERYRFGAVGLAQRLRYVGAPLDGETAPGTLAVGLTGSASAIARDAIAVNVGAPAATPATVDADSQECPGLQPWLSQTLDALSQTQALGAGVEGDLAAIDADAVGQAATEVAALGQTQRGLEAPEDAASANRLIVTALSTYARGLDVIANAATAQDADLLAQGQSVLADGDQLLQRAAETVNTLAGSCAEPSAA